MPSNCKCVIPANFYFFNIKLNPSRGEKLISLQIDNDQVLETLIIISSEVLQHCLWIECISSYYIVLTWKWSEFYKLTECFVLCPESNPKSWRPNPAADLPNHIIIFWFKPSRESEMWVGGNVYGHSLTLYQRKEPWEMANVVPCLA